MLKAGQVRYLETTIKNEKIKECISSPREYEFIGYLEKLGFRLNTDYVHQFACSQEDMGLVCIADFCFPKEKIIIELDGESHKSKKQRIKDEKRDLVFRKNGYEVIRIPTPLDEYAKILYKHVILDLKKERYELYESGKMDTSV